MLLGDKHFYPTKILPVADENDLVANINSHLIELLEIVRRAVVGIDDLTFNVCGRRHAVEGRDDARIIVVRVTIHVLGAGTVHVKIGRRSHINADLRGVVHPDFVLRNLGLKAGFAKFCCDVIGRGFVFRSSRHVRGRGQCAQLFFGTLRVGNSKEAGLDAVFDRRIAKTEDRP